MSHVLSALPESGEALDSGDRNAWEASIPDLQERDVRQIVETEMTLTGKCDVELPWLRLGRRRTTRKMWGSTQRRIDCSYFEHHNSHGRVLNRIVVFRAYDLLCRL